MLSPLRYPGALRHQTHFGPPRRRLVPFAEDQAVGGVFLSKKVAAKTNAKELGLPETKTLRDQLVLFLVSNGLCSDEAKAVVNIMAQGELCSVTFSDPVGGYPDQLVTILLLTSATLTIAWIDDHKPKHFARLVLAEFVAHQEPARNHQPSDNPRNTGTSPAAFGGRRAIHGHDLGRT